MSSRFDYKEKAGTANYERRAISGLSPALLPTSVPVRCRPPRKELDEDEARDKTSDMCREGDPSCLMGTGSHDAGHEKLNEEPVTEKNPRRKPPESKKHDQHYQCEHPRTRVEKNVSSHDPGDGSAGPDEGHARGRSQGYVRQSGSNSTN